MNVLEKKAELEAKQAELQAEMDRIKEEAELAERIEQCKQSAKKYLNVDVNRVKTKNHWVKRYAIEAKNVNVVVKKGTTTLTENAKTYINDDYTTVETFTEEVELLSLVYVNPNTKGEYKIDVDSEGGIELPYSVTHSFRKYKRISTVVYKIESYIESQNIQTKQRNAQEKANDAAVAHLTELYPDSTVKYEKGWVSNYGRHSGGYDAHRVMVFHPNGNIITMNVGCNTEKVFTLSNASIRFNKELSVYNILDLVK
jgi:hypothetical protein